MILGIHIEVLVNLIGLYFRNFRVGIDMRIGFTTSFPIEVVIGAGHEAIDLNNIFILSNDNGHISRLVLSF